MVEGSPATDLTPQSARHRPRADRPLWRKLAASAALLAVSPAAVLGLTALRKSEAAIEEVAKSTPSACSAHRRITPRRGGAAMMHMSGRAARTAQTTSSPRLATVEGDDGGVEVFPPVSAQKAQRLRRGDADHRVVRGGEVGPDRPADDGIVVDDEDDATSAASAPPKGMADFKSTLVSGQAPPSPWDVTQQMSAPTGPGGTQVLPSPVGPYGTQVMPAVNDEAELLWDAQATLPRGVASPAQPLPQIPGRTDGDFVAQGVRGTPQGELHYARMKEISDGIAAENAKTRALSDPDEMWSRLGLKEDGPTGEAWFERNYPGGKSALAAEEELATASSGVAGETSAASEIVEEVGAVGKIGKLLANPYVGGTMAGLNVVGGAADMYTGVNEIMDGKIGYGVADTAIGMGNVAVGAGTLAEIAMTGAASASPIGVALGAAALGVKGDKFFQETGLLDGVFGKDEKGESRGLVGGIGSVVGKALDGDGTAILETLGGLSMAPLLLPALATAEVGAGVTSLVGSGIDLLGGDSKAVGHAILDTASDVGGAVGGAASDIWHHFAE